MSSSNRCPRRDYLSLACGPGQAAADSGRDRSPRPGPQATSRMAIATGSWMTVALAVLVAPLDGQAWYYGDCPCPRGLLSANCSDRGLSSVPDCVSSLATELDFSGNKLRSVGMFTFSELPDLQMLMLKNNEIATISPGAFKRVPKLQRLYLTGNRLTHVSDVAFADLPDLRLLCLANNSLQTLPQLLFVHNPQLAAFSVGFNPLPGGLDPEIFRHTPDLKSLFLPGLHLSQPHADLFRYLRSLETLNLPHNGISTIDAKLFSNCPKLRVLYLDNNDISSPPADAFCKLRELQFLDMSRNRLTRLDEALFRGNANLLKVNLNHNPLREVPPGLFSGNADLEEVYLGNCSLRNINESLFRYNHNLKVVTLNNNSLEELHEDTFRFNPYMESIYLYDNRLRYLDEATFRHNELLAVLALYDNWLEYVPPRAFAHLSALRYLFLSNNRLRSLSLAEEELPSLSTVELHANPWVCDCRLSSLSTLLAQRELSLGEERPRCVEPHRYAGIDLFAVIKGLRCSEDGTEFDPTGDMERTAQSLVEQQMSVRCGWYRGWTVALATLLALTLAALAGAATLLWRGRRSVLAASGAAGRCVGGGGAAVGSRDGDTLAILTDE